jgi:recombination protein RecT
MSTELSTQQPQRTLRDILASDKAKSQISAALPSHLTGDRFIRVGLTAMTRNPKLLECTTESFMKCIMDLAAVGIEPDGRRAHLIPFWNNKLKATECQLILDYKGLAELVMRSGLVANIHADVVCENDVFRYNKGEVQEHEINFRKPRGEVYAVYAMIRFKDGTEKADAMNVEEIEAVRSRSKSGQSGPWVTDWNEMAKKTVFRRLSKWLTLSPEFRDAIEREDDHEDYTREVGPNAKQSPQERLLARLAQNPPQEPENAPESPETAKASVPADELPFTEVQVVPPEDENQEPPADEVDEEMVDFLLQISEMTQADELVMARKEAEAYKDQDKQETAKNAILKKAHSLGLKWDLKKGLFVKA